jgi:hypothetical protein
MKTKMYYILEFRLIVWNILGAAFWQFDTSTTPTSLSACPSLSFPTNFLHARADPLLARWREDAYGKSSKLESSRKDRNLTTAKKARNWRYDQHDFSRNLINFCVVPPSLLGIYMHWCTTMVSMNPTKTLLLIRPFHGSWGRRKKNMNQCNYMVQFIVCRCEQDKKSISYSHPANILQLHQAPSEREIKEA